jgi:hypothetical protein
MASRGGSSAIAVADRWDELDTAGAAAEAAGRRSFFSSRLWYQVLADTALDPGHRTRLLASDAVVLPLREEPGRRPRRWTALANFYSCAYSPLAEAPLTAAAVEPLARALRSRRPSIDVVDLHSLSHTGEDYAALAAGFRAAGWWLQQYFHFGNWYEDTSGLDSETYLRQRPTQLRNTLKRKAAAAAKGNAIRFELVTGGPGLERAIADYERIYAASWKGSEPYPAFAATLMRRTAEAGALRLGLMHVEGEPAAAQIWIVWHGRATIFKLAHDERFKALSLGSVLTWRLMQHVLDTDRVAEVDFGRGDDPYKQTWLPRRRECWGLMAFNPSTAFGLAQAARHIGGRWAKRHLRRLVGRSVPGSL